MHGGVGAGRRRGVHRRGTADARSRGSAGTGTGRCSAGHPGTRHPRSRAHARHAQRHRSRQLHRGLQLHAAPDDAGEPAEDAGRRPRRLVHDRVCRPGAADAGGLRQRLQSGGGEVRRRAPPHRADRAEGDRAGADRRRRRAHRGVRPQGGGHRHRERLPGRPRHQARHGVLRPRRPLHVVGAQRGQPARRLQHRRVDADVALRRPQPARQAGGRRDESPRDDGRRLAPVEGRDDADGGAVEGADHRVALGQSAPSPTTAATWTTRC